MHMRMSVCNVCMYGCLPPGWMDVDEVAMVCHWAMISIASGKVHWIRSNLCS
jgi:hypothetical protein